MTLDLIEAPPDDPWHSSQALDPVTPVRVVSAAGGLVVAAGEALHMLRPGAQRLRSRSFAPGAEVHAVAAEPWSPFRYAIATPAHVGVYTGHRPYEPIVDLQISEAELDATHLAWVRHDGESVLYLRRRGGEVLRVGMAGASEVINVPITAAIAADETGVLSLVTLLPMEDAAVWMLPDGANTWDIRSMTNVPVGDEVADWDVYLDGHRTAVAFSLDDLIADVSWEESKDESEHFVSPPGDFQGPIAFQDDRAIFAAYNVEGKVNVLRHVRGGGVTRIARFGRDDAGQGAPATVTAIAWDEERRALWAASPELGLIKLTARAAAEKKALPS